MRSKDEYLLQNLILKAYKDSIDIVKAHRKLGATTLSALRQTAFLATSVQLLNPITKSFGDILAKITQGSADGTATAIKLFNEGFGKGTRFDTWLAVQEGPDAALLKRLHKEISELRSNPQDGAVVEPFQAVVNAGTQRVRDLCFAVPVLQRLAKSENFTAKERAVADNFLEKFVSFRNKLISKPIETVDHWLEFCKKDAFLESERGFANLADDYETKIGPLVTRARSDNKSMGWGVFHWHLSDEGVELGLTQLYELRECKAENQLIHKLPDSDVKTSLLVRRQEVKDELLGERLTHKLIEKANPIGLGIIDVAPSKCEMSQAMISCLASHWLGLPESLNESFMRGCMNALLVNARPEIVNYSADGSQILMSGLPLPLPLLLPPVGARQWMALSFDRDFMQLLKIINNDSDAIDVVVAYCRVIESLASGQLIMDASPEWSRLGRSYKTPLEQVEAMAERLIKYVHDHSLQEVKAVQNYMDDVTGILIRLNKRDKEQVADNVGDITKFPILRLYQRRHEQGILDRGQDTLMELESRGRQVDAKVIALFSELGADFEMLRKPPVQTSIVVHEVVDDAVPKGQFKGRLQKLTPGSFLEENISPVQEGEGEGKISKRK